MRFVTYVYGNRACPNGPITPKRPRYTLLHNAQHLGNHCLTGVYVQSIHIRVYVHSSRTTVHGARQHAIDIGCTHHRVMQHCAENTVKETPRSGSKGGRLRSLCTCLVPPSEAAAVGYRIQSPVHPSMSRAFREHGRLILRRFLVGCCAAQLHACANARLLSRTDEPRRGCVVIAFMRPQRRVTRRAIWPDSTPSCNDAVSRLTSVACNAAKAKVRQYDGTHARELRGSCIPFCPWMRVAP